MRFLRLGGEPVLASDFELFQKFFPASVAFVNTFGITEAAGNVAYMRLDRAVDYPGCVLPVGIPAKDREIFLLDPDGQPADSGQIVVRSDFLATGYYRRPDLNERKFRAASEGKSRELWTGDLGHFTPEGWLMHDGRMDNQVKIRGQRRDLAGLEAIVRSVPGVSDARVLSIDGEDQLVAFVASSAPIKLPPLTIPLRIIYVSDLPLTSGGKVDRAKLIEHRHRSVFSPPRDESERTIAEIWREVLRISDFGVYDDFFALGGDSLRALQACAALEKHYRRKFPPLLFLERPTIAQLGEYVTAATQTSSPWRSFGVGQRAERVVPLRSPGANAQAPLFICPGGWGHENELLVFAALLSNLPADLPVYGLKQNFLRNSAKVAGSVGTMAKNYFREMRRIQSTGPYRLLGECIASVIVLELAHQIRRSREEVQCIILLDPRMPRSQTLENVTEPDAVPKKIRSYYRALAEAKPRACHQRVDVISTEDAETVRRRLEPWNAFDLAQLHPIRVTGNHLTYLREHGAETARAIAQLTSQLSPC